MLILKKLHEAKSRNPLNSADIMYTVAAELTGFP